MEKMSLQKSGITYKNIKKKFVIYINFRGDIKDIPPKIELLYQKYIDYVIGPAIAVVDYGVYSEGGKDIDICFELKNHEIPSSIKTKYLDHIEVLSITHQGTYDTLNKTFQKISNYMQEHLVSGTSWLRLVYHKHNMKNSEENLIEIQYQLHKWDDRLEKNLDRVLGKKRREEIIKDRENLFTLESSREERICWLKTMLNRIDKIANDNEKYDIISSCAHDFSQKRIDYMRNIYEHNKNIDEVITEMKKDYAWYENPIREGNIIYITKIPVNPEGYEKAKSLEDKKKNYCHCRFINSNLEKDISPTFCYCGTGWYRQQWEGILGKPVRIKILKSLLKGDDNCQVAIYLPQGN